MAGVDLAPGMLLIAPPALLDPNFYRSVVLLCEHSEEGSFGLVLNRILDAEPADVIEGIDGYAGPLSLGGPVQTDTLHYLHRHPDAVDDAILLLDGVLWGGDFDLIKELVGTFGTSPENLRFFLGYAGWGAGQLDDEIEQGGWIVTPAQPTDVFPEDPTTLWRSILRRMGGEYAVLANFPDDPRMN